ncbi:MAG: SPOR domain-containing protein [Acidobacteria bacterium]|nr:SPOR domain-containing protein [Acidobacteriota bacterium]
MTKSPQWIAVLFLTVAASLSWNSPQIFAQSNDLTVQVASYLKASDAQAAVNRLRARKLDAYWVKAEIPGMGTRYRVRIGRYAMEDDATIGAANACKSRAISQYLVANGESVPVGVPAKTCRYAMEVAARLSPKTNKSMQLASNASVPAVPKTKPPVTPPAATPATSVTNSAPVAPKVADKTIAKQTSPNAAVASTPVQAQPIAKPVSKNAVTNSPANTVSKAAAGAFVPASSPKEIVSNAYKYATARSGNSTGAQTTPATKPMANSGTSGDIPNASTGVNSLIARSVAGPGLTSDVAIANPKWKVSQANITSDKNLRAVHFVNSWTGWAAGEGGTIYQTSDGGKQWTPIRNATIAGAVVDVNRIFFLNENRGWMLAESRNNDQTKTVLLSTEDGGKIWQNFEMPNVTNFFFMDGKKGWAVGKNTTLLRTVDGGMKWKTIDNLNRLVGLPVESATSTFGFSDVFFLKGGDIGWAVGNFYGTSTSNIGGLFMTTNGGDSWQRIPIAVQRKTNSTRFTKGKLHSVRFTDVTNGVITGEMEDGDEHFFFTLKTRNGGETWEQARVPSNGLHSTQFVDSARGWTAASALREGSAQAKVYDTILLRTDNGGRSWVTDFVAKGKQIRGVYFISPTRGWAVGDQGMILRYDAK